MSLTINAQIPKSSLQSLQGKLENGLAKLASGKRINRSADDAAGLSISEKLKALVATSNQAARNLSDGISVSRVAEGGLSQIADNLGRMRELAVQAQNGTLDQQQKTALQEEYDSLSSEVDRVSESTKYNGQQLLNGDISGGGAIRLEDGSGGAGVDVAVESQSAGSLGLEGLDITDGSSMEAIDGAQQAVSSARAQLGSVENRLGSAVRNLQTQSHNTAEANARMLETDYAKATSESTRDQILQQFQVALRGQANASAGLALRLLE